MVTTEEVRIEDCGSDKSSEKSAKRKFSLKSLRRSLRNSCEFKSQVPTKKSKKFSFVKIFYKDKIDPDASGYGE